MDWAAETWEDYVNECVSACKGAPFPNLLNQDSFWDASLLDPRKASHQETSFGIIQFVIFNNTLPVLGRTAIGCCVPEYG